MVLLLLVMLQVAAPAAFAAAFAPAAEDKRAKQALPPSGQALIYVFRREGAPQRTNVPLFLDGQQIGTTEPRSYYLWAVTPGKHTIAAKPDQRVVLPITVQAGRNYFIEHGVAADSEVVSLRPVSYAQGRVAVNNCRLLQDGSAAAALALGKPAPKPAAKPKPVEPEAVPRAGFALILKTGSVKLATTGQDIQTASGPVATQFDDKVSSPLGFEAEWRMANGFAVGAELLRYSAKLTETTSGSGLQSDMDVTNFMVNAKKYFAAGGVFYPYFGAGLGLAQADFSGAAVTGSVSGLAFQAMGGLELRWQHVGVYSEFKLLTAKPETDAGDKVDASSRGIYLGVSVMF
jgi:opacity protein-like surface antigen